MSDTASPPAAKWRPINAIDRRVLGVLIEKAKTTPDQYPMSLNSLVNGCNQKSNRHPLMELDEGDLIEAVDRLRALGVVAEVQGGGRVPRYRHYAYEWLGVDKAELSIMTELLLRGSQTEGELRTRVNRMDSIADLDALRGHLEKLAARKLIVSLTPPGRGHVVTHALYEPRELEKERSQFDAASARELAAGESAPRIIPMSGGAGSGRGIDEPQAPRVLPQSQAASGSQATHEWEEELAALRDQVRELRAETAGLAERCANTEEELRRIRDALGG